MGLFSKPKQQNDRDQVPKTAQSFAETMNRFPTDQLLRQHGFEIYSRYGREPQWLNSNTGHIMSQTEALLYVSKAEKKIKELVD